MSWLNLSLKLHIRLRTISHLVPTHFTHVYVQWMPYSFVWLYLIKCVVHTQSYVDQTQKDFRVFIVVFGKCFVLKIFRKSKNFCNSILATHSRVKPFARPQSRAYSNALTTLWQVNPPIKKCLENFSKFLGFWHFQTQFSNFLRVEALIVSLHRRIHNTSRDLLVSGPSSREKHLEKFSIFCSRDFGHSFS